MATKDDTTHFLNKELDTLANVRGGKVVPIQATINTAKSNKIRVALKISREEKNKKITP